MRTTEARMVALVQKQKAALASRRINRQFSGMTTACILLTACLFGLSHMLSLGGLGESAVAGLYGSVLLYDGAGGYVFLGVLAFVTGAFVTILGFRFHRKHKTHKEKELKVVSQRSGY